MQILLFKKNSTRTKLHFCWHPIFFLFNPCLAAPTSMTHYAFSFSFGFKKTSRPGVQHLPAPPPARDKHAGASARTRERDLSEKQRPFPCLLYSVSLVLPAIPSKVQPRRSRSLRRALYLVSPSFLGVQVPENQGYKRGNQLHHPPGAALSS